MKNKMSTCDNPEVPPFWENKTLTEMSDDEWEALCDGCARCCLHRFIETDAERMEPGSATCDEQHDQHDKQLAPMAPGEHLVTTRIACRLLDITECRCQHYEQRQSYVPDCVSLRNHRLDELYFMPNSCAYRRLHEGKPLPTWHPLRHKGDCSPMQKAGIPVRSVAVPETEQRLDRYDEYIITLE